MKRRGRQRGSVGALLTAAVTLALALVLLLNKQSLLDQVTVWQYKPSGQISAFVNKADMSKTGEFYFYASQPSLNTRQDFNNFCSNQDANTAVLGCYVSQKIYIYDINNPQLSGIRTVTAAHEMLHAAYARLSSAEKAKVNSLLEAEYVKLKEDQSLASRMAFYAKTEPGQGNNELHSVIATEIPVIATELETYYKRYFNNRQKVTDLYASYQAVFNGLKARADQLTQQLDAIRSAIEDDSKTYNTQASDLNSDIRDFNARANNNGFTSQAQFNQERAALAARADQLDALRSKINNNITQYNFLREELAKVASQSDALNRSINSNLAPVPSL